MKIACLCVTYNRPAQLAESIECFRRQTHPQRELVILDDAGQYDPAACDHLPGVKLVTTRHRFRTLGEKRNACAGLVSPDVDALALWDDDDIYLPWHLEQAVELLTNGKVAWSRPAEVWIDHPRCLKRKKTAGLFHATWVLTRDAFLKAHGYPAMQSGQDQALGRRLRQMNVCQASPVGLPSFIYRWFTYHNARHLSAMGRGGYERRGVEKIVPHVGRIQPIWSQNWPRRVEQATK